MENVYDMGKVFRNEGISHKHSPEFTIIEFMCAYSDYNDVATVTEEMFRDVAQKALGRTVIKRNGEEIDLAKPWRRVTMRELILERFGARLHGVHARAARRGARRADGPAGDLGGGRRRHLLGENRVARSTSPRTSSTSRSSRSRSPSATPCTRSSAEHFDAVIGGIELVSGDTELNDPVDQWQRFVDQRKRRMIDDADVPHPNDEEYARAIEYGYSPTAGGGMGVDRLVMILTERDTLREVIPFPIVRDLNERDGTRQARPRPGRGRRLPPGGAADRRRRSTRADRARTTVSVERSVTRLLGVDGADELEVPLPNVLVDHVHERGGLGRGIAYWLGNAMLQTAARRSRSPRRSSAGELDLTGSSGRGGGDPRARQRGVRQRAAAEDIRRRFERARARCASASARRPRRCATC